MSSYSDGGHDITSSCLLSLCSNYLGGGACFYSINTWIQIPHEPLCSRPAGGATRPHPNHDPLSLQPAGDRLADSTIALALALQLLPHADHAPSFTSNPDMEPIKVQSEGGLNVTLTIRLLMHGKVGARLPVDSSAPVCHGGAAANGVVMCSCRKWAASSERYLSHTSTCGAPCGTTAP